MSDISRKEFEALKAEVEILRKIRVGPGLELKKNSAGIFLSVSPSAGEIARETPDTPLVIVSDPADKTADTDDFDWEDDEDGVELFVLTGVAYDTTAHAFKGKKRKLTFDTNGLLCLISGETVFTIQDLTEC